MKNRDHKSKQALIDYLSQDTDERFWQAINNFGKQHGLCEDYLLTTSRLTKTLSCYRDLFFMEADKVLKNK